MKILSVSAMREVERLAIEVLGIPSIVLMENAALAVVDAALDALPEAESALVFCGPGNNGGDGLAIARHLAVRGLRVVAVVATGGRDYQGDALIQFQVASRMRAAGLELRVLDPGDDPVAELATLEAADFAIDAVFGTGLSRALDGAFAALVGAINELEIPIVAVDLPSGLAGDSARVKGPCVDADLTVTFAAAKAAHVLPPASEHVGAVAIADLGIPPQLAEEAEGDVYLLEADVLAPLLAPRSRWAHKGDFGHLLVVGGSPGKSGAAILAARAAVRSGAGLVTVAGPEPILEVLEAASIETMSVALPASADGRLGAGAVARLRAELNGKDAVAVGPGLGDSAATAEAVREFCLAVELPLVLDADGLNAFAGAIGLLTARTRPTVLTPHPGEMARLLGVTSGEIAEDRVAFARRAALESGAVVILKGHSSLIADPEGGVFVNPTGNPGMATGGSGDVLTGVVGSLLAQGADALAAAQLGVFVHGLAGDAAAADSGERSLAAGDLLRFLPTSFEELRRGDGSPGLGGPG